jgi:hypothetical protein
MANFWDIHQSKELCEATSEIGSRPYYFLVAPTKDGKTWEVAYSEFKELSMGAQVLADGFTTAEAAVEWANQHKSENEEIVVRDSDLFKGAGAIVKRFRGTSGVSESYSRGDKVWIRHAGKVSDGTVVAQSGDKVRVQWGTGTVEEFPIEDVHSAKDADFDSFRWGGKLSEAKELNVGDTVKVKEDPREGTITQVMADGQVQVTYQNAEVVLVQPSDVSVKDKTELPNDKEVKPLEVEKLPDAEKVGTDGCNASTEETNEAAGRKWMVLKHPRIGEPSSAEYYPSHYQTAEDSLKMRSVFPKAEVVKGGMSREEASSLEQSLSGPHGYAEGESVPTLRGEQRRKRAEFKKATFPTNERYKGEYAYTIRKEDVGKGFITTIDGKRVNMLDIIGTIQKIDVGKEVWKTGADVYQVENDEQRDNRLAKVSKKIYGTSESVFRNLGRNGSDFVDMDMDILNAETGVKPYESRSLMGQAIDGISDILEGSTTEFMPSPNSSVPASEGLPLNRGNLKADPGNVGQVAASSSEVVASPATAFEKKAAHPFKVGDSVKLRADVLQRHSRNVPAHMGYSHEQFEWRKTLGELEGKTGKIERVFPNSQHVNVEFEGVLIGIDASELESVGTAPTKEGMVQETVQVPFEIVAWDTAKLVKGVVPMQYAVKFQEKYNLGQYGAKFNLSAWKWNRVDDTLMGVMEFPDKAAAIKFYEDNQLRNVVSLPIEKEAVEAVRFDWKNLGETEKPVSGPGFKAGVTVGGEATGKDSMKENASSELGISNGDTSLPEAHRELSIPDRHQLKIAKQTLRMPDEMIGVMGGPSRKEAEELLKKKFGYSDKQISKMSEALDPFAVPDPSWKSGQSAMEPPTEDDEKLSSEMEMPTAEEFEGPDREMDVFYQSYGHLGSDSGFFYQGKEIAKTEEELKSWMEAQGYWPSVWSISDHGNVEPYSMSEAVLTTAARKHIAPSNFAFPKDRRYPIHDIEHARNALARVSQSGTDQEKATVRRKVHAKYPSLAKEGVESDYEGCKEKSTTSTSSTTEGVCPACVEALLKSVRDKGITEEAVKEAVQAAMLIPYAWVEIGESVEVRYTASENRLEIRVNGAKLDEDYGSPEGTEGAGADKTIPAGTSAGGPDSAGLEEWQNYERNDKGIITSPGKFEGEMYYVPYYYDLANEGGGDLDLGNIFAFKLGEEDWVKFPELKGMTVLMVEELDNGFVQAKAENVPWEEIEDDFNYESQRQESMEEAYVREVMGYSLHNSDKLVIKAFLKGKDNRDYYPTDGKNLYLEDDGKTLSSGWEKLAQWTGDNRIKLGQASGNVSQTWINAVRKMAKAEGIVVECKVVKEAQGLPTVFLIYGGGRYEAERAQDDKVLRAMGLPTKFDEDRFEDIEKKVRMHGFDVSYKDTDIYGNEARFVHLGSKLVERIPADDFQDGWLASEEGSEPDANKMNNPMFMMGFNAQKTKTLGGTPGRKPSRFIGTADRTRRGRAEASGKETYESMKEREESFTTIYFKRAVPGLEAMIDKWEKKYGVNISLLSYGRFGGINIYDTDEKEVAEIAKELGPNIVDEIGSVGEGRLPKDITNDKLEDKMKVMLEASMEPGTLVKVRDNRMNRDIHPELIGKAGKIVQAHHERWGLYLDVQLEGEESPVHLDWRDVEVVESMVETLFSMPEGYGDKRDKKKIEIFVKDKDGKFQYKATTTWADTCKQAKNEYLKKHSSLKAEDVKCSFKESVEDVAALKIQEGRVEDLCKELEARFPVLASAYNQEQLAVQLTQAFPEDQQDQLMNKIAGFIKGKLKVGKVEWYGQHIHPNDKWDDSVQVNLEFNFNWSGSVGTNESKDKVKEAQGRAGGEVLYCLVRDGYLIGADKDFSATEFPYWELAQEVEPGDQIVSATVPSAEADKFIAQGTSDQVFGDGYEAYDELKKLSSDVEVVDTWEEGSSVSVAENFFAVADRLLRINENQGGWAIVNAGSDKRPLFRAVPGDVMGALARKPSRKEAEAVAAKWNADAAKNLGVKEDRGRAVRIISGPYKGATGVTVSMESPRNQPDDVVVHLDDECARQFKVRVVGVDKADIMHKPAGEIESDLNRYEDEFMDESKVGFKHGDKIRVVDKATVTDLTNHLGQVLEKVGPDLYTVAMLDNSGKIVRRFFESEQITLV